MRYFAPLLPGMKYGETSSACCVASSSIVLICGLSSRMCSSDRDRPARDRPCPDRRRPASRRPNTIRLCVRRWGRSEDPRPAPAHSPIRRTRAHPWRARRAAERDPARSRVSTPYAVTGNAASEFQYASNIDAMCGTTGPIASTSRSRKWISSPASKYASPMLRPPMIACMPSTMYDLLCMRRFRRRPSSRNWPIFENTDRLRTRNGLNRRTSMFGCASSASSRLSSESMSRSSSRMRTRTPRSAAARRRCATRRPVASLAKM